MSGHSAGEMSRLPPPISTVHIPRLFSPSNFAGLLLCPLSVLHGLRSDELLPPHPRAILGTLIHKAMEYTRRSSPGSSEVAIEVSRDSFYKLLEAEEARLATDSSTRGLVPLNRSVGRTAWRNRLAYLKSWASSAVTTQNRAARTHRTTIPDNSNSVKFGEKTNKLHFGAEKALVAPELRLSGRPDHLELDHNGTIQLTDLKTGPILNREGHPDDKYALQVRLYALMVEQVEPYAKVELWLEGAQKVEVPWDETLRAAVLETLEEVSTRLPPEKSVTAETIANTGRQCWNCRIRHRCSLYRREAPAWWVRTSVAGPVAPFDIWGTVLEVDRSDGRVSGLEMLDAAGRRVRLRGLESRLGDALHLGAEIWLFNLEPSEDLPAHGIYRHPRNYHATAPSRAWSDALRLKAYIGEDSGKENAP